MSESQTITVPKTIVIAGTRPVGSCAPDGSHIWTTLSHEDGLYTFTNYNGWLIDGETKTTDRRMVNAITDLYRYGHGEAE